MFESLRNQISDAEDVGVNALVGLKDRAAQLEDWADDGIAYLRQSRSTPLMIGAAVASIGAMALYAAYSYWRAAPAKTRKIVAARARKEVGKVSRKIAKSGAHRAAEKMIGADKIAKTPTHRAMEKMAKPH